MEEGDRMGIKGLIEKMKENKPDKTGWVIFILVGILLLVIALPSGESKEKKTQPDTRQTQEAKRETAASGDTLKEQLEAVLSNMEGVGKVRVMITYKDSGTQVIEKDGSTSEGSTLEEDASGGSRKVTEKEVQKTTVYSNSGEGEPFVAKELAPEIEGILIVAQGGDKTSVRQNISNAVLALFPVEAHKIVVVKMND